jgi:PemK-like, MazF-like toxin of type II toxin-antitoxin system
MVIRYSYLWLAEHERGAEEGRKDRPAAVILVLDDHPQHPLVTVLPITHARPLDSNSAVEIPSSTRQRLRLGGDPSWIVISEANDFRWPGPDLRPLPGEDIRTIVYGILPPGFFRVLRARVLARVRVGRFSRVQRPE